MYTAAARRSLPGSGDAVVTVPDLLAEGWTHARIRAQVAARRWRRIGPAVVRHNGPMTPEQSWRAALIVLGPRAALTSFTGLQSHGLTSWTRPEIHVLVPRGARVRRPAGLPLRVHYTDRWQALASRFRGQRDSPAHAALLAAAGLRSGRCAVGVVAATVQQRLLLPDHLLSALDDEPRLRHRHLLITSMHDIAQGAQALSEIDFARVCRRYGLPLPQRQVVRTAPGGRRRYLDAEWVRADGRSVVAEVDGALHLAARRWWEDQLRQNELVISGDLVLRFPTVVLRTEPRMVADQLARALRA